jgi:imidazolonepropionase-like amidohydrolase
MHVRHRDILIGSVAAAISTAISYIAQMAMFASMFGGGRDDEDRPNPFAMLLMSLLAHTPTATLSDEAVAAWASRGVISTLRAFGGGERAVDNLKRLHEAGATVLYGTDMGNSRTAAIDGSELALLASAGLSPEEILTAATSAPAATWGFEGLGGLTIGGAASFLLLDGDPLEDITRAASPAEVWVDGVRVTP